MRIPRKKKKYIPKGIYCYTTGEHLNNGFGYKIKPCPYYEHEEYIIGRCKLLNREIEDQCKICNCKLDLKDILIAF